MYKIITFAILSLLLCTTKATSQFSLGLKFGIHSFDLNNPRDIIFPNNNESLAFKDAKIGFQGGLYTKIEIGSLYLEPRFMLNSTKVEYTFNGESGGISNNVVEESFTNLDIPVLLGFGFNVLDIYGGPVAHVNLSSTSDLVEFSEYNEMFSTATFGFRAGVGIDIGKINIGLEYEGNFSKFGDHINLAGSQFSFDTRPSRLILNVGFRLI